MASPPIAARDPGLLAHRLGAERTSSCGRRADRRRRLRRLPGRATATAAVEGVLQLPSLARPSRGCGRGPRFQPGIVESRAGALRTRRIRTRTRRDGHDIAEGSRPPANDRTGRLALRRPTARAVASRSSRSSWFWLQRSTKAACRRTRRSRAGRTASTARPPPRAGVATWSSRPECSARPWTRRTGHGSPGGVASSAAVHAVPAIAGPRGHGDRHAGGTADRSSVVVTPSWPVAAASLGHVELDRGRRRDLRPAVSRSRPEHRRHPRQRRLPDRGHPRRAIARPTRSSTTWRELGALPVRAVVNTHGHTDHAFGDPRSEPRRSGATPGAPRMVREHGERGSARRSSARCRSSPTDAGGGRSRPSGPSCSTDNDGRP